MAQLLDRRIAELATLPLVWMWLCLVIGVWGCGTNADPPGTLEQTHAGTTAGDTMRIHFERAGGFGGLQLTVTIESDTLPEQDLRDLTRLIAESDFFNLAAELSDSAGAADLFVYELTIGSAERSHTVKTDEIAAPQALRPLLDWLTRAARRKN